MSKREMDTNEAVAAVVRLGIDLADNSERVCPACQGIMALRADLLGCARWVCRKCGYSTT